MASIEKRVTKDGLRVYKFRVFIGKNAAGKQLFEYATWKPPEGLTAAKEMKLAEAEAYRWEQEIKNTGVTVGKFSTILPDAADPVQEPENVPYEETFRFRRRDWDAFKGRCGWLTPIYDCYVWIYDACCIAVLR